MVKTILLDSRYLSFENQNNSEKDEERSDVEQERYDLRRETLIRSKKLKYYETYFLCITEPEDPVTFEDVLNRADNHHWKEVIRKEVQSLEENNTWTVVHLFAVGNKVIQLQRIFKSEKNKN